MAGAVHNYSLWMEPAAGAVQDRLRREVRAQAAALPGAPEFEPHVTLLPDVKSADEPTLLATAAALATRLEPFRINFNDVSRGASYHQCVYILCDKSPVLLAANAAAREAYGLPEPARPYMPHLSLLYADVDDAVRRAASDAATARLWGEGAGYDTLLVDGGFDVGSFSVWLTPTEDTSLSTWRRVAEFQLSGGE